MFPKRNSPDKNPLTDGLRPETSVWLQDGLRELRDVPEHGLSNERLRDRLLATGLDAKPAPSATPWWAWALAPAAAAFVALAVVPALSSRLRGPSEPQILPGAATPSRSILPEGAPLVLKTPEPALRPDRVELPPIPAPASLPKPAVAPTVPKSPVATKPVRLRVAANPDLTERRRPRRIAPDATRPTTLRPSVARPAEAAVAPAPKSGRETLVAMNDASSASEAPTALLAPPMPLASLASVSSPIAREARPLVRPSVRPKADPLVILASEIDADTGAVAATEVDSHKNVSVGG